MKNHSYQFTIEEVETLCKLYQDCQLSVMEETELEYVLTRCDFSSPIINESKALMAVSRSVKLAEPMKTRKPILKWAMRVAACVAIVLGIVAFIHQIGHKAVNDDCIVYVAGERASDKVAHEIAEADVAKMQQFMQTVNEQKALEQAKVEQFMNHINQSK